MLPLFLGAFTGIEVFVMLLFVLAPIILLCWLVVALIRWLNRH